MYIIEQFPQTQEHMETAGIKMIISNFAQVIKNMLAPV